MKPDERCLMFRLWVSAAAVVLLVGCGQSKPAVAPVVPARAFEADPISLYATVTRGFHSSFGAGLGGSDATFHVHLHLKNTGDQPLRFAMAEAAFVNMEG